MKRLALFFAMTLLTVSMMAQGWPQNYGGRNFKAYRNVFAIPTTDLTANPNLTQNEGYR